MLPLQGGWVQSLVGELRSHMPKKIEKKNAEAKDFQKSGQGMMIPQTRAVWKSEQTRELLAHISMPDM